MKMTIKKAGYIHDGASVPKMQAAKSSGQEPIKKGASVPRMAPAPEPTKPNKPGGHQGNNSQTTKPSGDKK